MMGDSNGSHVAGKPPINEKPQLSPKLPHDEPGPSSSLSSPQGTEKKSDLKVDRKNDPIYLCTTNVVRAIMKLSSGVELSQMDDYLELVKTVGLELRTLLGTVDQVSSNFPAITHRYLKMFVGL